MGMEFEDIILGIEGVFDLSISDKDAEYIWYNNLHYLFHYVLRKAYNVDVIDEYCLSSRIFYRLRKSLMNTWDIPRNSIAPKAELKELFPIDTRVEIFKKLEEDTGLKLPELICLESVQQRIHNSSNYIFLLSLFSIIFFHQIPLVPASIMMSSFLNYWLNEPRMIKKNTIYFPEDTKTLRDMVKEITQLNYHKLYYGGFSYIQVTESNDEYVKMKQYERMSVEKLDEIWEKVREIVSGNTGIEEQCITKDTRIEELCY